MKSIRAEMMGTRFTEIAKVSNGKNGVVYKAIDRQFMKKVVAVKEMHFYPTLNQHLKMQFEADARFLSTSNFEGIPRISNYFIENDKAYIVMEWIEGDNLEQLMAKNGRKIPVFDVFTIMRKAANILKNMHGRNPPYIHMDIKPENIIIPYPGDIRLVDLGSPGVMKYYDRSAHFRAGEFEPPEQFLGNASPESDISSLCAVAHYLFSGIKPAKFPPFCFPPIEIIDPDIPDLLATIISRGLHFEPEYRYKSIDEFLKDLEWCSRYLSSESIYADQFNCPHCRQILMRGRKICFSCGVDFGIYGGTDKPGAYMERGIQHLERGNIKKADRCFFQAVRLRMEDPEIFTLIARCRHLFGETDMALRMLANIQQRFSYNASAFIESLRINREIGNKKEINILLDTIRERFEDNPELTHFQAEELFEKGKLKKALELAEQSLEKDPDFSKALELKALILWRMKKTTEMIEFITSLRESCITSEMHYLLALSYIGMKEIHKAIKSLFHAVNADPLNSELKVRIAEKFKEINMDHIAMSRYREALRLAPDDPEIIKRLTLLMIKSGQVKGVMPYLCHIREKISIGREKHSLDSDEREKNSMDSESFLSPKEGADLLKEYSLKNKDDGKGWFTRGFYEYLCGDFEKAKKSFNRSLSLIPGHGPSKEILKEIEETMSKSV